MPYTYLIPTDSSNAAARSAAQCQNMGLILARYVPQEAIIETKRYNDRGKDIGVEQSFWIRELCRDFRPDDNLLKATYARWQAMTAGSDRFTMTAQGRLLVGLGGKGVMEIGITLSHVTGLPYIPGSALKGLTRAYGLFSIAAELKIPTTEVEPLEALDGLLAAPDRHDKELRKALDLVGQLITARVEDVAAKLDAHEGANTYRAAFGSQDNGGVCVFHDAVIAALPRSGTLFKADVMTPHFKDYYDDVNSDRPRYGKAPDDGQNPNPILFITVAERTQFAFAVGLRRTAPAGAEKIQEQAVKWLQTALFELGIGAKTAAGYGVFTDVRPLNG